MSKKNETQQPSVYDELLKNGKAVLEAPTYDELLKNGKAVLEAPTREALAELVDNIPADCKYSVGCVGRKQDGSAYTIQVEII